VLVPADLHCPLGDLQTAANIARVDGDFLRYEVQRIILEDAPDVLDAAGENLKDLRPAIGFVDDTLLADSRGNLCLHALG